MPYDILDFKRHWARFLVWGLLLIILGGIAIGAATFTTLITVIFLGALILATGILVLIDSFHFWKGKGFSFVLHFMMGALYILVGLICITGPAPASISLTLLLALFFMLLGIFRIWFSLAYKFLGWKWSLVSGILALVLGVLIMANWPASGLVIIGLFIGIDLMVIGWYYVMMSLVAKTGQ